MIHLCLQLAGSEMMLLRRLQLGLILFALMQIFGADRLRGASSEWKPITADELKMTSVPEAPGASAICLFTEVFTDDLSAYEHHYVRIKVLTDEGRSQGNLQIPFVKGQWDLKGWRVRTIQPDGTVAENPGTLVDSVILRYRRNKVFAKTLALGGIQPGTIIEYQYNIAWDSRFVYSRPWVVDGDLFTVRASFARRPSRSLNLRWYSSRIPAGHDLKPDPDGQIRLELRNVAASRSEDFMPPEAETRPRVDFYYYSGPAMGMDTSAAWASIAKSARESFEKYLSKDSGLDRFLAETVKSEDNPETLLRKLYARVQAMRNLSFEDEKTKVQSGREALKPGESVADVIKHGYGWRGDLDMLFLALVRRAGLEAWLLDVAQRDGENFFDHRSVSLWDLPGRAVLVHVADREYFLDPGTVLLPFGLLSWGETSVEALRLDTAIGGFVATPEPLAAESAVERKAELKLREDGTRHDHIRGVGGLQQAHQRAGS